MPEQYAVIDLGSNSFRLEVGHFEGSVFVSDRYVKKNVRLAAGFAPDGSLTRETQERAIAAIHAFASDLEDIAPSRIRAVGTQALRVARDTGAFITEASSVLGIPVRIISGTEEARLTYLGCVRTLRRPAAETRLVVDIGGASTELILGEGDRVIAARSFPVGSVNVSLECFPGGLLSEDIMNCAVSRVSECFRAAQDTFDRSLWQYAYGSAGTVSAIHRVAVAEGWGNGPVTTAMLEKAAAKAAAAGRAENIDFKGLTPVRRDIISGGIAVLLALFRTFRVGRLGLARGALRTGLLYSMKEES